MLRSAEAIGRARIEEIAVPSAGERTLVVPKLSLERPPATTQRFATQLRGRRAPAVRASRSPGALSDRRTSAFGRFTRSGVCQMLWSCCATPILQRSVVVFWMQVTRLGFWRVCVAYRCAAVWRWQ